VPRATPRSRPRRRGEPAMDRAGTRRASPTQVPGPTIDGLGGLSGVIGSFQRGGKPARRAGPGAAALPRSNPEGCATVKERCPGRKRGSVAAMCSAIRAPIRKFALPPRSGTAGLRMGSAPEADLHGSVHHVLVVVTSIGSASVSMVGHGHLCPEPGDARRALVCLLARLARGPTSGRRCCSSARR
jgi:hypothetical protein